MGTPHAERPSERDISRTTAALLAAAVDGDDARATELVAGKGVHPLLAAAVAVRLAGVLAERTEDPAQFRAELGGWMLRLADDEDQGDGDSR